MAVRRPPYELGAIVRLRPGSGRSDSVTVTAPDGMIIIKPTRRPLFDLWLPQIGTWTYVWSDGSTGSVEVVEAVDPEEIEDTFDPALAPSMTISRGPRR